MEQKMRCGWAYDYPEYLDYHDLEWGHPVHDDRLLFEMLSLSGVQAGLSWITVLRKREHFRNALNGFDACKIAEYGKEKMTELLADSGIIRNRQKLGAIVSNARAFQQIQRDFGSFDAYLWGFVGGKPVDDLHSRTEDVPARTELSDRISEDLKKRGFKFVGTTVVCAFMHMAGLMNGHSKDCFCRGEAL